MAIWLHLTAIAAAAAPEPTSRALWEAAMLTALADPPPDEASDPKAARSYRLLVAAQGRELPAAKLSYRGFVVPNVDASELRLHAGQIDIYGLSRRGYRIGVDVEIGAGRGAVDGAWATTWYFGVGPSVGFQWPWRVTPFVDARFIAGFFGGQAAGKPQLTWILLPGIDAGFEVYLSRRYYLSFALGWVHPIYRGVNYAYQKAHPTADAQLVMTDSNSLTFKFGVGM